jgi:hypothetical protein
MTLIARTIIPLIDQPSFAPPAVCASQYGCGSTFGLGDVQEQLFFAPKTKPGALIWGVGPIFQVPSASPGTLGAGKWAAGPTAVALIMPGNIVTGILVSQIWSFAGQVGRPNISSALFQPFLTITSKVAGLFRRRRLLRQTGMRHKISGPSRWGRCRPNV